MNAFLHFAWLAQEPAATAVKSAAEERLKLWGAYSLGDPWFLLAIPLGFALLLWGRARRGRARGRVPLLPSTGELAQRPWRRSLAQRCAVLVPLFQLAALVCVSIALARPLRGSIETSSTTEGIDIALVIDRSGSMTAEDLAPGKSRLQVVKEVVRDFAVRRMTDREAAADNIAVITFAAYAQLLCPFTLDVDAVTGFIASLQPVKPEERALDGTGIGIGLGNAVKVLRETRARSKVVVLLTDGENNIDKITPTDAARMAAESQIKVYTVFAGRYVYKPDVFGRPRPTEQEIDTSDLREIASLTGGRFFRARDQTELESVYAEIEKLERTPREEKRWSETYDLYPWYLAPGALLYAFAWLLSATWLRRIT